jgi:hypothetical protein
MDPTPKPRPPVPMRGSTNERGSSGGEGGGGGGGAPEAKQAMSRIKDNGTGRGMDENMWEGTSVVRSPRYSVLLMNASVEKMLQKKGSRGRKLMRAVAGSTW